MARAVLSAAELVLRDLVDTLLQEGLCRCVPDGPARAGAVAGPGDPAGRDGVRWYRIDVGDGAVRFRGRPGGPLQPVRFARGPAWHVRAGGPPRPIGPDALLALVAAGAPRADEVGADLRTAVAHAAVVLRGRPRPRPGELLGGERLAATRNRPFHPTARAASGWTAAELARWGTARPGPLGLAWVGVRPDRLRHGGGEGADRLPELLLGPADRARLADAADRAGAGDLQPLPVHPWQLERVLPAAFGAELARGEIVPLAGDLGSFAPTASLRTLATAPESDRHVKLPLGVATLGAARLLPPRYLDNGERAERLLALLRERDPVLRARVRLCDERTWAGWRDPDGADEFDDRPGQLAAQLRAYPPGLLGDPDRLVLPMAALAAHDWAALGPALGAPRAADALALFGALADAFCELGVAFLRHGVLPELHGQNVVVVLAPGAAADAVRGFVLRDHDTVRLHRGWMDAAGVPDPGYRIRPGAPQSLCLERPEQLVGYLQTLGLQVNLYGIADALCRHHGVDERATWGAVRAAVAGALERLAPPGRVADVLRRTLLDAPTWPSRQLLGPLLRSGTSTGVSMPAATGAVPNPLRAVG